MSITSRLDKETEVRICNSIEKYTKMKYHTKIIMKDTSLQINKRILT